MDRKRIVFLFNNASAKILSKIRKKSQKSKIFSRILSAGFRIALRFRLLYEIYFRFKYAIKSDSIDEFWIVRIGFLQRRVYFPYLNINPYLKNKPQFCTSLIRSPFKAESCKEVYVKHFFKYLSENKVKKFLRSYYKKLIPAGALKIEVKYENNEEKIDKLIKTIEKNDFFLEEINKTNLKINGRIILTALKEKKKSSVPNTVNKDKMNEILRILRQNYKLFSEKPKICIFGFHHDFIVDFFQRKTLGKVEVRGYNSLNSSSGIIKDFFDVCIICNFLELIPPRDNIEIFTEIKRIVKPEAPILLIVPEKNHYKIEESQQIFDKGILTQILDNINIAIEWETLNSTLQMIQVLLENRNEFPLERNGIKICLLGNYCLRYSHLTHSDWDGQIRAFDKLGYETLTLDMKDNSYEFVLKRIKDFKPDILWTGGNEPIEFFMKYAEYFRNKTFKVIYWFWDPEPLTKFDFRNIIDYIFYSVKGGLSKFKMAYNVEKVYYMPNIVTPQFLHRNRYIREKYDIVFTGSLDFSKFHKSRTLTLLYLSRIFNVKTINYVYNNYPELYAQSKIIFGGAPDMKHVELYLSNRFFFALSCGSCYINNYVKGLEKLGENEKHFLWYNNKKELVETLKKYLANNQLRFAIKENAEKLAKEKHNYLIRIQNMLDIINGKTEGFYGFIS